MQYLKVPIERPVEFVSGGLFVSDVPWTHAKRNVDSFEIIIGMNECLYISQGSVEYEVRPGDVLLLLPGQIHEGYRVCDRGVSFFWLHFTAGGGFQLLDGQQLSGELSWLNAPSPDSKSLQDVFLPLFFTPSRVERVNILFQQLQHVVNSDYYTRQAANYITTSLLIELSEQMIKEYSSAKLSQGDKIISEMIEWIRLHAQETISVGDVAEKFTYNKDYVSRLFKKKTGYHLQEYIHLIKIAKAKELLTRCSQPIREIADYAGFPDEKYFMRLFKRYESMTPTEYRQAYYRLHMNNH